MINDLGLEISLEDVEEYYSSLEEEDYCKIKGYYLYKDKEVMKKLAKDELDNKLEDTYEVADMWIFRAVREKCLKYFKNLNVC